MRTLAAWAIGIGLLSLMSEISVVAQSPLTIHTEDEVKAEAERVRFRHVVVQVNVKSPNQPVTGYVGATGRSRFDVLDASGNRIQQVRYKDVLAFINPRTNETFVAVTPTWASQHHFETAVIVTAIAVGIFVIVVHALLAST